LVQELQGFPRVSERSSNASDDWALLEEARRGDMPAMERFVAAHKAPIFRLCVSILGSIEDAEDAVQDTFLRALRALHGFRRASNLRTWLTRIAVNVCNDILRSRILRENSVTSLSIISAEFSSPEREAVRRLGIREALLALPARQRILLLLKEMEGLSVDEIASIQRWSRRRVYYELALAHKALAVWRHESGEGEES